MAHTVQAIAFSAGSGQANLSLAQISFSSYVAGEGGEPVIATEFKLPAVASIAEIISIPTMAAGKPLFEQAANFVKFDPETQTIMLMDPANPGAELPSTDELNVAIYAFVTAEVTEVLHRKKSHHGR